MPPLWVVALIAFNCVIIWRIIRMLPAPPK